MLEKMIQIVLWLLAFLGITLLVIMGLILLLFILMLFVPIRYRGDFSKDADTMILRIKGSWLLRLIRIRADYEKELLIRAYVLFFKVFDSKRPAGKKKTSKKKKLSKKEKLPETENSSTMEEAAKEEIDRTLEEPAQVAAKEEPVPESEDITVTDIVKEKPEDSTETTPKQSPWEKLRKALRKIFCKIKGICDRIKDVVNNIQYYLELLYADETKVLFKRSMSRLLKVLKSIRPRKLETELIIGTGEPDTTGYVMALAGIMYPYFGRHVNIEPDFEKTIFEGKIFVSGHITMFVLLWQALKIYRDKDLRAFMNKLKREDA